jgi:signal transduction histidine kinase
MHPPGLAKRPQGLSLSRRPQGRQGAARSVLDLADPVLRAVTGLVESRQVGASLSVPDHAGRLRVVASRGTDICVGNRTRSSNRRRALRTGSPVTLTGHGSRDGSLETIPLIDEDSVVGVLEIQAPRKALDASREPLRMIVSHAAMIWGTDDGAHVGSGDGALGSPLGLAHELVVAGSPRETVRRAVARLHEALHVPVAGWLSSADGAPLGLVACRGVSRAERAEVQEVLGTYAAPDPRASGDGLAAAFSRALGGSPTRIVDAGRAVLAVARVSGSAPELEAVGLLLRDVLPRLQVMELARQRNDALDTGLAWTAHEVRTSLDGIRVAVEAAGSFEDPGTEARRLLRLAGRELDRLSADVESVLRWAVGERSIRCQQTDLMRLVREVAAVCSGMVGRRVVVEGPSAFVIPGDSANLRTAIANLVRNALLYADHDRPVFVRLVPLEGSVLVKVRNQGPTIPREEREAIFDPFVRGRSAGGRPGNGLGLFVARRVAEAHGGALWSEPDHAGATFVLRLPLTVGRQSSTAS